MKLESQNLDYEETSVRNNFDIDETYKNIKDKIETALKNVESIKDLKPTISWSSKEIVKDQNVLDVKNNNEIVLCVAIKMKKNL